MKCLLVLHDWQAKLVAAEQAVAAAKKAAAESAADAAREAERVMVVEAAAEDLRRQLEEQAEAVQQLREEIQEVGWGMEVVRVG
jgi:chromosome segregation ATPase